MVARAQQHLGADCPPSVCVSGWPDGAAVALLQQLAGEGAVLYYHGDFDGEGLRIAAHVMARTGARPRRMGTDDYLEAVTHVRSAPPPGRLTPVPRAPDLEEVVAEHGTAVHEERVSAVLVDELRYAARFSHPGGPVECSPGPVVGP